MKNFIALVVSMFMMGSSFAADDLDWKPYASFKLENSNLQQMMLFVSGMSYGLTEYSKQLANNGMPRLFCPQGSGLIQSPLIFEILNDRYAGKNITAEQATTAVFEELPKRLPCK